jgi:hypothetical protein
MKGWFPMDYSTLELVALVVMGLKAKNDRGTAKPQNKDNLARDHFHTGKDVAFEDVMEQLDLMKRRIEF